MSTALEKLKSLKEQLEKEESGGALKPPFPTLFLHNNPDPDSGLEFGKFYVGEKGDGEWLHLQLLGDRVEVVVLKERGQYIKYDPKLEKLTVKSTILPKYQISNAKDLISGRTIAELKEAGEELTYTQITLALLKLENTFKPVLWYLKRSSLRAYIEAFREKGLSERDYKLDKVCVFRALKQKNSGVIYFIPVLEKVRPIDIPEAEKVLEGSKAIEVFQEWVDRYNSRMVKQETASEEDLEPSNVPFDEDDELELDI